MAAPPEAGFSRPPVRAAARFRLGSAAFFTKISGFALRFFVSPRTKSFYKKNFYDPLRVAKPRFCLSAPNLPKTFGCGKGVKPRHFYNKCALKDAAARGKTLQSIAPQCEQRLSPTIHGKIFHQLEKFFVNFLKKRKPRFSLFPLAPQSGERMG